MRKLDRQVRLFLIFDAFLILFCIVGIYHLDQKADLPFTLIKEGNKFIIYKTGEFHQFPSAGDTLISIDGMKFSKREEIEILLDSKRIGDKILLKYRHHGIPEENFIKLTKYYTLTFIVSNVLCGSIFIVFGIFVLLKCPKNKAAKIFHWGSLGVAIMLLNTWGNYTIFPYGLGVIVRLIFQFSYTLTPAIFVWFALTFPVERVQRYKYFLWVDFLIAIIISLLNIYYFILLIPEAMVEEITKYQSIYESNRIFSSFNIFAAIVIFFISHKKANNEVDRKKLKWMLTGFIIGPLTFIVLWAIPHLIFSGSLMPEIIIPLLMTAIPLTFTIAIVKYHLLDIDLLIRRSVVYSIVIVFLILIYIVIISVISNQIFLINDQIPSIIAAIVIALLFEPIRRRIQLIVNKMFFRVHYNFNETLRKFLRDISEISTIPVLAETVVKEIQEFIPVSKIGFFLLQNNHLRITAHRNFDLLVNRSLPFNAAILKSDLSNPIADPSKIETGINFESADLKTFKRWEIRLVISVKSSKGEPYAFIALGEKKSGARYSIEDIDLLNTVSSNIALTLERIRMQEELIRKNMEAERLEELNKQKTLFVSTVSHDLKTPLASIKVFSEMMKNDKQFPEKHKQYIEIIEGESDRLSRLINNVLGFARIENGTRKYLFESISINTILLKTLDIMSYQIRMEGFKIEKKLCGLSWIVSADPDAVIQALINVITNAIKFSIKDKIIFISTFRSDNFSCIEIRDRGIGIKPEDLKNLFKPFFRSEIADNKKIKGTGLGLSIIKHVMDAHNGKIEVESIPDEGTSFILKFPIEIDDSMNLYNKELFGNSLYEGEG